MIVSNIILHLGVDTCEMIDWIVYVYLFIVLGWCISGFTHDLESFYADAGMLVHVLVLVLS